MKNSTLSIAILFSFCITACGLASDQNYIEQETEYFNEDNYMNASQTSSNYSTINNSNMETANYGNHNYQQTTSQWNNSPNSGSRNGNLKDVMVPHSQTGRPMLYIPVPSNWQNTPKGFKGPSGLHAYEVPDAGYTSKANERIVPAQEVLNQYLNIMKQQGHTVTNSFEIPSIARNQQRMQSQMWKYAPSQDRFTTFGIETIVNGKKALMVIMHQSSQGQFFSYWTMSVQKMTANDNYYTEAKKAMIHALSNMRYDQQFLAHYNHQEQSRASASDARFQTRMRNNQANFQAMNRATVNAYNDINEMSMNGYYSRSNSQDRMQQQQVQGIWERTTVQDSHNGQYYEVEGQAQNYWMDGNGNYISSDDLNWNPNSDYNYNGTQWTQAQKPNDNY